MRPTLSTALALLPLFSGFATAQTQPDRMVQINLDGGWARRTAEVKGGIPSEQKEYLEDLRSGWQLGGDGVYFFTPNHGGGLAYNLFLASNSDKNLQFVDTVSGSVLVGTSDNISLTFVGPLYAYRVPFAGGRFDLQARLGMGYLGFNDEGQAGSFKADLEAGTFGLLWALGVDARISRNVGLGLALKMVSGSSEELKVNGQKVKMEDRENFGHVNLTAGLRFYL